MIRNFTSSDELAEALADYVAEAIQNRLARDAKAAIALSGGTTPVKFFQALSKKTLNWPAITITLVDDRWVEPNSPRSNAALLQTHLLQGPAAAATFLPLVNHAATPEAGRAAIDRAIGALPAPFAAIILGMGTDGHTASFFPGGDRLAEALNPTNGQRVETIRADAAAEPRITLTLPTLLAATQIAIHIEGPAKRQTLNTALQPGPIPTMPIRAILIHQPLPDIFWCA